MGIRRIYGKTRSRMTARRQHTDQATSSGPAEHASSHEKTGRRGGSGSGNRSNEDRGRDSRNPVAHVAAESRALWDDLREWVDLRVQLIQIDIEERIEKALNDMLAALIVVVLVLFALFFLLQAAALWLGQVLGHDQMGYVVVALTLIAVSLLVKVVKPTLVRPALHGRKKTIDTPGSPSTKDSLPDTGEQTRRGGAA